MFFIVSKVIHYLFNPLIWIVFLFLFSFWIKNVKVQRKLRWVVLALLIFFTNPFLINTAMRIWEVPGIPMEHLNEEYDVVVVLGGAMRYYNNETKRPVYGSSLDRVMQSALIVNNGKAKYLLLSGGSGLLTEQGQKESIIVKDLLTGMGMTESKLWVEVKSRNTYENAVESASIIKKEFSEAKVLLVTSGYHMRRSMACFAKQGIHVSPFSVDQKSGTNRLTPDKIIIPNTESLVLWELLLHEWIGYITYHLVSYL